MGMDLLSRIERQADVLRAAGATKAVCDVDAKLGGVVLDFVDADSIDRDARFPSAEALADTVDDVAAKLQGVGLVQEGVQARSELGMKHELAGAHAQNHTNALTYARIKGFRVTELAGLVGYWKERPADECGCRHLGPHFGLGIGMQIFTNGNHQKTMLSRLMRMLRMMNAQMVMIGIEKLHNHANPESLGSLPLPPSRSSGVLLLSKLEIADGTANATLG